MNWMIRKATEINVHLNVNRKEGQSDRGKATKIGISAAANPGGFRTCQM
jgi:hypothetical protein